MEFSPQKYIDRLSDITSKKYKLLQDILVLTKRQSDAINEDGLEVLEKLIGEKQVKIDEIGKLDEEFNVYYQRFKTQLNVKSLGEVQLPGVTGVKELQALVNSVMNTVTEITSIESVNNSKAKNLLDMFAGEVRKINQGKQANGAYDKNHVKTSSYFVDYKK